MSAAIATDLGNERTLIRQRRWLAMAAVLVVAAVIALAVTLGVDLRGTGTHAAPTPLPSRWVQTAPAVDSLAPATATPDSDVPQYDRSDLLLAQG